MIKILIPVLLIFTIHIDPLSAQTRKNGLMVMISYPDQTTRSETASQDSMYSDKNLATLIGTMIRDYKNYSFFVVEEASDKIPLVKSYVESKGTGFFGWAPADQKRVSPEIMDILILENLQLSITKTDSSETLITSGAIILYSVKKGLVLTGYQFTMSSLPGDLTPKSKMISVASKISKLITGTDKTADTHYADQTVIETQDDYLRISFFGGFSRLFHMKATESNQNSSYYGSSGDEKPSVAHFFEDNAVFQAGVELKFNSEWSFGYQFTSESMEGNGDALVTLTDNSSMLPPSSEELEITDHYGFICYRYISGYESKFVPLVRGGLHFKNWVGSGNFNGVTFDYKFRKSVGLELAFGLDVQLNRNFGGQGFIGLEIASTSLEALELGGIEEEINPAFKLEDTRFFIGGRIYFDIYATKLN